MGNDSKVYNGLVYSAAPTVTYSGFVNDQSQSVLGGTLTSGGTGQGAINAGDYTLTASGLTSANYAITYLAGTLTINRAPLTITATNSVKTYGQTAVMTYTSSGLQNGETIGTVTLSSVGAAPTAPVSGSPYVITAGTPTGGTFNLNNYDITYGNGTLTVNKASLTVTASNGTKVYNGLAYSGGNGVTYSGFVNGDTATLLGGVLAYGGTSQGAINTALSTERQQRLWGGSDLWRFQPGSHQCRELRHHSGRPHLRQL